MYRGIDGFLPFSRASIMLDVVFVAMFVVIPVMGYSIWQVKRKRYLWHRNVQTGLAAVLLVAVLLFELDMQFVSGWLDRAHDSPYFEVQFDQNGNIAGSSGSGFITLYIHLVIAVTTFVLWVVVLTLAWRKFGRDPKPGEHSAWHARLGWLAAVGMTLTAITGWVFYVQAFVAG